MEEKILPRATLREKGNFLFPSSLELRYCYIARVDVWVQMVPLVPGPTYLGHRHVP